MITELARVAGDDGPELVDEPEDHPMRPEDHPMRKVTRAVAFGGPQAWTPALAVQVEEAFDTLAPRWQEVVDAGWAAIIDDAIARGIPETVGPRALEVGSGNGTWTPLISRRFRRTIALDLSGEMLRRFVESSAIRVQADAAKLPIQHGSLDAVVLINAFLFPHETARVLRPDGVVVWVNGFGERTPIHLLASEVAAALSSVDGTTWDGVSSRHGTGTWTVVHRRR